MAHDAERDLTRAVRKLTRATVHAYPAQGETEHLNHAREHRHGRVHAH